MQDSFSGPSTQLLAGLGYILDSTQRDLPDGQMPLNAREMPRSYNCYDITRFPFTIAVPIAIAQLSLSGVSDLSHFVEGLSEVFISFGDDNLCEGGHVLGKALQLALDEFAVVLSLLDVLLDLEEAHGDHFPDHHEDHLHLLHESQAIEDTLDGNTIQPISKNNCRPDFMSYQFLIIIF